MAADLPHNAKADHHFNMAEQHTSMGSPATVWHHLNQAQHAATRHAQELVEGGKHSAALAYRKITMGRVGHIATKLRKAVDAFTMTKYSALAALWDIMKKNGPNPYKYAIPQIELAKSPSEIDNILAKYGIKLNRDV